MLKIHYLKLQGDCSQEQSLAFYRLLPEERKKSVDAAGNPEIAKKRLWAGVFLQIVLAKESNVSPDQLQFTYNAWGKPEVNVEGVYFNMSHSGKYVVVAVSDQSVGVDVEHKSKNGLTVARRCFCQEEYEDIAAQKDILRQQRRFLEYWTGKESYIKYVGKGMKIPFHSFCIIPQGQQISQNKDEEVYYKTVWLNEEYCMSVCSAVKADLEALPEDIEAYKEFAWSLEDCAKKVIS